MKILVSRDDSWVPIERRTFAQEELLEQLIHDSPEVIPLELGVDRVIYARQFDCPPGYAIDLVGIGSDGSVTIVECKLARNRESKRQVVGQILEYAAGLWGMAIEDFERRFIAADSRIQAGPGRSPFAVLTESSDDPALVEAEIRDRVAANLDAGRFRLLIAVDEISDQLQAIIRYLNGHAGGQLKLVALALPEFADDQTRVLVPTTFGDEAPPAAQRQKQEPVPPEELIRAARSQWQHAIRSLHDALAERTTVEPRPKSIRYLHPLDRTPVATIWPSEGNLYGDKSNLDAFMELRALAQADGIRVTSSAITFAAATDQQLAPFIQAALDKLVGQASGEERASLGW
jgi:hypothetical protein